MFKFVGVSILVIVGMSLCITGVSMWLGLLLLVIAFMSIVGSKVDETKFHSFLEGAQHKKDNGEWSFTVISKKGVEYESTKRFPDRGLARLKMYLFCKESRDAETVAHYLVRIDRARQAITENESSESMSLAGSSSSLG